MPRVLVRDHIVGQGEQEKGLTFRQLSAQLEVNSRAYNALMVRAAILTLLVVFLVMGCLQAQRPGTGFSARPSARSALAAPSHLANRFPRRGSFSYLRHRHVYGPFFYPYNFPYDYYPYDEAIDYERLYTAGVEQEAEPGAISPPASEAAPAKAQVIDIPAAANSAAGKRLAADDLHLGQWRASGKQPISPDSGQTVGQRRPSAAHNFYGPTQSRRNHSRESRAWN